MLAKVLFTVDHIPLSCVEIPLKRPTTPKLTNASRRAYSTMSCPSSSYQKEFSIELIIKVSFSLKKS